MESIFEAIKKQGLVFLSKYSDYFHKTDIIKYNDIFDYTTYDASFMSITAKRIVDISFNYYPKSQKKSISITVKTFEDKNNHYDYIILSGYLRSKMVVKNYHKIGLLVGKNEEDLKKEVLKFFHELPNVIDKDFIEIIKGTKWINIPFDWSFVNK